VPFATKYDTWRTVFPLQPWTLTSPEHVESSRSILFVIPWTVVEGAEEFEVRLLKALFSRGWRITIACTLFQIDKTTPWLYRFLQYTSDIFILPSFLQLKDQPSFIRYLIESRRPQYTIITSTMNGYTWLPYLYKTTSHITYFIDFVHAEEYPSIETIDKGPIIGHSRRSIDNSQYLRRSLVCSRHLKDLYVEYGRNADSIGVVYVGIDETSFKPTIPAPQRVFAPPNKFEILFVSRMVSEKRPDVLVYLARHLRDAGHTDFHISMCGDGGALSSLKRLAVSLKVADVVTFTGERTPDQVRTATENAHVLILPSLMEGVSLVLYQALAMETPVITSDVGGNREIVDESYGFVIPAQREMPDEQYALMYVDPIIKLKTNPSLWLSMAVKARVAMQKYSGNTLGDKFVEQLELAKQKDGRQSHFSKSLVRANNNIKTQAGSYCDLNSTVQMHMPARYDSRGRLLQSMCGGSSPSWTSWIENILSPKACADQPAGIQQELYDRLFDMAKYQCGQWCLFDVEEEYGGYSFERNCFKRFYDRSHHCEVDWPETRKRAVSLSRG
jgi:glycosyltransferase involved in cell wall biosynthesis